MAVTIAVETPLQDAIRALVADLNAHLEPLSPPEFQFQMTAEQMAGDDTTVFVARDDTRTVVGMGALRRHDASLGEVKRMFSIPAARGTGIGWRLLQAIEAEAGRQKLERLVLETGGTEGFEPAWALYERAGFTRCGVVLDYPDSEYSRFYEMMLPR
ncbi:GNAT family N-acetyltransferase [Aurantimonas endophytica]|uniref:Putative acetyltransferase n=1 Tax=Aurantimonas endophytica TaxID=1522175 RepID=A0A7W6HAP4_9HYPH|nr:GNAT family N-acetyltransferase [Aurantimonas endophytica]MBB4001673.1 putative acetyltransferase [Aurantimonas endophytica]MCO6402690.1 GNAT family N-acetyltransferase [Aurantimonas endophytica]